MTIHQMRTARPAYNLISNNCQNFAIELLKAIQIGAHKEFATSFAVYQTMTGKGSIKDLFDDKHPEEQQQQQEVEEQETDELNRPPRLQHANTMLTAQQVMDEQTTKLDAHQHRFF
jgi:4-diphosphocytidyl-2C-methyl-D-erythritol kinase